MLSVPLEPVVRFAPVEVKVTTLPLLRLSVPLFTFKTPPKLRVVPEASQPDVPVVPICKVPALTVVGPV